MKNSNLNMEEFYTRKLQSSQPGSRAGGSPRLKSNGEGAIKQVKSPLRLIETPMGNQKPAGLKGTPTGGQKNKEPKLGKSSIADVGVSPQKESQPNPTRKRSGQNILDESDAMANSGSALLNGQKEDSFQKLYSKELDLDEDEVPVILHELNDSAIHFISHEQFERSLSLLQKAQTLLDRLQFQKNPKDRFLIQVTMHNMALCFQKMGALEECALCLDACLHQINSQYLLPNFSGKPTRKLKKIKYECKIHMQVCALLSQLHRHQEALCHAKRAVQISQYLLLDLLHLCEINFKKSINAKQREQRVHEEQEQIKATDAGMSISQQSSKADLIYYDETISMLERTSFRIYPIIKEIAQRMVKHKDVASIENVGKNATKLMKNDSDSDCYYLNKPQPINMKVLLGYLNQSEWLYLLNIGNIMQITPLTIHDLYSNQKIDVELSRDSILEKISYLAISYFCVSTELRFLVSSKEKLSIDPVQVKAESEFWHGKALEIACGFLPSESPLVTHILSSYQKHHAPVQQSIPEDSEADLDLRIIRPERGIDKSQFQPMIRLNKHLNIALSPLSLSPCNHSDKTRLNKPQNSIQPSVYSHMESISSETMYPPEHKEVKLKQVVQTSIEDLGKNHIMLNSSVHAVIHEQSPRSPKEETKPIQEDDKQKLKKQRNLVDTVLDKAQTLLKKELEEFDETKFDETKELSIKFDQELSNPGSAQRSDKQESIDLDEAEFIQGPRMQKKLAADNDESSEQSRKAHTKVFLKHEKIPLKTSPSPKEKVDLHKVAQTLNVQVISKPASDNKKVNQSMMAVPPSQVSQLKSNSLATQDDDDKRNQSMVIQKQQKKPDENTKANKILDSFEEDQTNISNLQTQKSMKKLVSEADGPDKPESKKQIKDQISVDQLKEFLKQGKIQAPSSTRGMPQSAVVQKRDQQRPQTTLPTDEGKKPIVENLVESKVIIKRPITPGNKDESSSASQSLKAESEDTSFIFKSDNSFVKNELHTWKQKPSSSQEKSRSKSNGKTQKKDSVERKSSQGKQGKQALTVPNSNKLTSRDQQALTNQVFDKKESKDQKARPPSSNLKKIKTRPDSRRNSNQKRRKVVHDDEGEESRRSESDKRYVVEVSVDKSQASSKGGRASNFKTFQAQRQGANTHHVTTSHSPSNYQQQQKPRSSGQIGIGQMNSASNIVKLATSVGFNAPQLMQKPEDKKIKGRNQIVDQSLISNNSLNSYATESRNFQNNVDRSILESQSLLQDSRIENQSLGGGGSQNEQRRIGVRPKSKKQKLNPQTNTSNHQIKQQQILQNEILSFLNSNQRRTDQPEEVSLKKQLLIRKALEMQLSTGIDARRKSANATTTHSSLAHGIAHSLSSAANGFQSMNTTHGNQASHLVSTPIITQNHIIATNTLSGNIQNTGSNSAQRKILQVVGQPQMINNEVRSQKNLNIQRLGIQTQTSESQSNEKQSLHNAQAIYNQLLHIQSQKKPETLTTQNSQKKFFKERVSPQTVHTQQTNQIASKPTKKKSVSPHNNQATMIDNYTSNLFIQSNTGITQAIGIVQQKRVQNQQPRINQVAQQQYSTNIVTTQSRKGAQERFISDKNGQAQREPTPVFEHQPYNKKERPSSSENTYVQTKPNAVYQRQTLSNMYLQMKEQKEKEKKQYSSFTQLQSQPILNSKGAAQKMPMQDNFDTEPSSPRVVQGKKSAVAGVVAAVDNAQLYNSTGSGKSKKKGAAQVQMQQQQQRTNKLH